MLLGNYYYNFFQLHWKAPLFWVCRPNRFEPVRVWKKWTSCPKQVNGKLFWATWIKLVECSLERKNISIDLSCRKKFLKYHSHRIQYQKNTLTWKLFSWKHRLVNMRLKKQQRRKHRQKDLIKSNVGCRGEALRPGSNAAPVLHMNLIT